MTTNLKTFPRKSTPQSYERWKKAFEKKFEEIELDTWLDKHHPDRGRWATYGANILATLDLFIKREILGEEASR